MTNYKNALCTFALATVTSVMLTGCLHGGGNVTVQQPNGAQVQVATAPSQPFNPTVTPPPPAQSTESYVFNAEQAPTPVSSPIILHHRHRYLHIVLRDHQCYLADNYGDYYATGRDDNGDLYPVYQDPVTGAVYPLYYDSERDSYYRCVEDGDNGYYRNYCGDPDDEFYQGDPDQQEECESDDCQPFVINYGVDYDSYNGYDPDYGYYSGPHYSRHDHDLIIILPVIVAAYILFEDNGGGGGGYNNTVVVGHHRYYQRSVVVQVNGNGGGGGHMGRQLAAMPGPPLGHFQGYNRSHHVSQAEVARALPPESLSGYNHARPANNSAQSHNRTTQAASAMGGHRQGTPAQNRSQNVNGSARTAARPANAAASMHHGTQQNGRQATATGSRRAPRVSSHMQNVAANHRTAQNNREEVARRSQPAHAAANRTRRSATSNTSGRHIQTNHNAPANRPLKRTAMARPAQQRTEVHRTQAARPQRERQVSRPQTERAQRPQSYARPQEQRAQRPQSYAHPQQQRAQRSENFARPQMQRQQQQTFARPQMQRQQSQAPRQAPQRMNNNSGGSKRH